MTSFDHFELKNLSFLNLLSFGFNPGVFNPVVFNTRFMDEKTGVEVFMIEKSGLKSLGL